MKRHHVLIKRQDIDWKRFRMHAFHKYFYLNHKIFPANSQQNHRWSNQKMCKKLEKTLYKKRYPNFQQTFQKNDSFH